MDKALLAEQLKADRDCNYRIWKDYHRKMLGASGKQKNTFGIGWIFTTKESGLWTMQWRC